MKTVNSLSGGKTSSYLASHFPADLELFALVCIDDHNANCNTNFKVDAKIKQMVNDKLQKYCSDQKIFKATAEDPRILKTMFDLEQHLGREIIWLRGIGWQEISNKKKLIPNKQHRYCTTLLKIDPIFNFLFKYHDLPVRMRIGFRADESERKDTFKESYLYATHCETFWDERELKNPVLKKALRSVPKTGMLYMHRWKEVPFRIGEFPLINAGIEQYHVQKYWQDKSIIFPEDSNCQFCFWKHPQQLRQNFDTNQSIMASAIVMEEMIGGTFHHKASMYEISKIGIQTGLFQMKGGGCHGGYCTS